MANTSGDVWGRPSDSRPGGDVYEVNWWQRHGVFVAIPFFLVIGAVLLTSPDDGEGWPQPFVVGWLVLVLASSLYWALWVPTRAAVDDGAVTLVARARRVRIPWHDLVSVRPRRRDASRRTLVWRRRSGRKVTTASFVDQHRLLATVERRAPQAEVRS